MGEKKSESEMEKRLQIVKFSLQILQSFAGIFESEIAKLADYIGNEEGD